MTAEPKSRMSRFVDAFIVACAVACVMAAASVALKAAQNIDKGFIELRTRYLTTLEQHKASQEVLVQQVAELIARVKSLEKRGRTAALKPSKGAVDGFKKKMHENMNNRMMEQREARPDKAIEGVLLE